MVTKEEAEKVLFDYGAAKASLTTDIESMHIALEKYEKRKILLLKNEADYYASID